MSNSVKKYSHKCLFICYIYIHRACHGSMTSSSRYRELYLEDDKPYMFGCTCSFIHMQQYVYDFHMHYTFTSFVKV